MIELAIARSIYDIRTAFVARRAERYVRVLLILDNIIQNRFHL